MMAESVVPAKSDDCPAVSSFAIILPVKSTFVNVILLSIGNDP